ncbi:MAG: NUDIX hydrolase [Candidatus Nanohaloarchaea archaeon]
MSMHYTVGANVILKNDQVLLVQEGIDHAKGEWNLPAGGVEPHESLKDAAKREAKEETNLIVDSVEQVKTYKKYNQRTDSPVSITVYKSEIKSGKAETPDSDEIMNVKYFDINELENIDLRADYILTALRDMNLL